MIGPVSRALVALNLGIRLIGDGTGTPTPSSRILAEIQDQALHLRAHQQGKPLRGARLPSGIVAEVLADAPLVKRPIDMDFDSKGRLWVLERVDEHLQKPGAIGIDTMPGARIVMLSDTDGDGRLDLRAIRADRLALPASILVGERGVYVGQPRGILWLQDSDGHGRLGTRTEVFGVGPDNGEKPADGSGDGRFLGHPLFASIDNWIYSPRLGVRFRSLAGRPKHWIHESFADPDGSTVGSDEFGRLIHSGPGHRFYSEPIPYRFLRRNPKHAPEFPDLLLRAEVSDASVSVPSRSARLSADASSRPSDPVVSRILATGALIYRGDLLPGVYRGDLFVCDPGRHIVLRHGPPIADENSVVTHGGAQEVFLDVEGGDFTPVQLKNGPDGALYVADMGSDAGSGRESPLRPGPGRSPGRMSTSGGAMGHVLRIAIASGPTGKREGMLQAPPRWDTARRFSSSNGFWQSWAQRALVEDPSPESTGMLAQWVCDQQRLVGDLESTPASVRLRALWTLEGQGRLTTEVLRTALEDPDPVVKSTALQIVADQAPGRLRDEAMSWVLRRSAAFPTKTHPSLLVCLAAAATPLADGSMLSILLGTRRSVLNEDAAIGGLSGRELGFISQLAADPRCGASQVRHARLVRSLGECIRKGGNPEEMRKALDLACRMPETDWRVLALVEGLAGPESDLRGSRILQGDDNVIRERIRLLESRRLWPTRR